MTSRTDMCLSCPTRPLCVGSSLDDAGLRALGACLHSPVRLDRGAYLYRAWDSADGCFVVRSGSFKRLTLSESGDERVTGFDFPGDLLGLGGLATGRHADYAIALETATACRVENAVLPDLWRIGAGTSLLRLLGEHDRRETAARLTLAACRADSRVAGFLLDMSARMARLGRDAERLPIAMSRTDLADYLGMTLESLSRVMARLTRAGLIRAARAEITLQDREGLGSLVSPAGDCADAARPCSAVH